MLQTSCLKENVLSRPTGILFARHFHEYLQAFRLVYRSYLKQGYIEANRYGMRFTHYHLRPGTSVLLSGLDNQLVGTLSIVEDSDLGLPIEMAMKGFDIRENRRVAEFSSLAIDEMFRQNWKRVLLPLLQFAYHYCRYHRQIERIVLGVHPQHARFYERVLHFQRFQGDRVLAHPYVNHNPVITFYRDLNDTTHEHFRSVSTTHTLDQCGTFNGYCENIGLLRNVGPRANALEFLKSLLENA